MEFSKIDLKTIQQYQVKKLLKKDIFYDDEEIKNTLNNINSFLCQIC